MLEVMVRISIIFLTILIGFGACKIKWIERETQKYLVPLLLNINIPCMLLYSISSNQLEGSLSATVEILVCSSLYFAGAAVVSHFLVRRWKLEEKRDKGVYEMVFTSINAGFIGFPVSKLLFGDMALYSMVLVNIVSNIYLYSLCPVQLNPGRFQKKMGGRMLRGMVNPCMLSAVLSIILLFSGIRLPLYIKEIIQPIGDATIPLAMILIGIQLADSRIRDCFRNKRLVSFSIMRMLIWPSAVLVIISLLPLNEMTKIGIVLGAVTPPATTIAAIAAGESSNYRLAAEGIVVTTLLFVLTMPIMVMLINQFIL